MYSTFRAQPPSTSAGIDKIFENMVIMKINICRYDGLYYYISDSNPDPEMSQDSNPGNGNYMRGEV